MFIQWLFEKGQASADACLGEIGLIAAKKVKHARHCRAAVVATDTAHTIC